MAAPPRGERVEIGVVSRAHGIRGEVVVITHDPASETMTMVDEILVGDRPYAVTGVRPSNQGFLVALEGVVTRNDAEALRGAAVSVARDDLDLDDDELLLSDLIGCRVVRADGTACGEIVAIDPDAQPRLVIHDGELERLVPLVDALVPSIDLDTRTVTVAIDDDWPSAKKP